MIPASVLRRALVPLVSLGLSGCAGSVGLPGTLLEARRAFDRAERNPFADRAPDELLEAAEALSDAERTAVVGPTWQAQDRCYIALRLAERARIAALHGADRDALLGARRSVRALREEIARRAQLSRDAARRRAREAEEHSTLLRRRRAALHEACEGEGVFVEEPWGFVVQMPAGALFLPETAYLRADGRARLEKLAAALRIEPAPLLRVQVLENDAADGELGPFLVGARLERIFEALRRAGVAGSTFLRSERYPRPGTQVDFIVTEVHAPR